ncbi:MAG: enoyl-CoA hydratase/isomerase family protein [Alphaproteobacteria bacterium]|nr:enoyl-CoA hydratase/isomerase family protein [Alphaproteobacteria bacterium]
MPVVLTEVDDRGVATVTLNRPHVHNAYDGAVIDGLIAAFAALAADPAVRVVLLRGNGRHFQAGADLAWLKHLGTVSPAENRDFSVRTVAAMRGLQLFPRPTVALVHGACFGGGVGLAAGCDVVVASEEARFALTEVKFGVVPAPIIPQLIKAIGLPQLRRWGLTAEPFGAARAERMGLVHEVCPTGGLDAAAAPIVDALLRCGPEALAATKRLTLETADQLIPDALAEHLVDVAAERRASPEAAEGLASFLEKRNPAWYRG